MASKGPRAVPITGSASVLVARLAEIAFTLPDHCAPPKGPENRGRCDGTDVTSLHTPSPGLHFFTCQLNTVDRANMGGNDGGKALTSSKATARLRRAAEPEPIPGVRLNA